MGDSSQTQTSQTQGVNASTQTAATSSTRNPWAPASQQLNDILGLSGSTFAATSNPATNGALAQGQNTAIGNATQGNTTNAANQGFGVLSGLFGSGGLSDAQKQALGGISGSLGSFNTGLGTAASYLTPIANGSQVGSSNPEFQTALKQALGDASDTINSTAAGWGGSGSVAQTKALADRLGGIAANATQQQYNTDRQNQLSAIGQLSGLTTSGLSGNLQGASQQAGIGQSSIASMLAGIGAIPTLGAAQGADANTLMGVGNSGWSNLGSYASIVQALAGLGGTTSGMSSGSSSGTTSSNGTATTENSPSILGDILATIGAVGNFATGKK